MTVASYLFGTVALAAAALPVASQADSYSAPPQACYSGAYRFANGGFVVIAPSSEGALRYRVTDGRTGRLYPSDDKHFDGGPGWAAREPRIAEAAFDGCSSDRLPEQITRAPPDSPETVRFTESGRSQAQPAPPGSSR